LKTSRRGAGLAFVAKLALFLVPLLLVLGWFEVQFARHPEELRKKHDAWIAASNSTRILVLGSSHALFGVRCQAFAKPAFNLGWVSQTLYYDSALLSRSLARMPHLETVVQTVSYFTLEEEMDDARETSRAWAYGRIYGITPLPGVPRLDSRRFSRFAAQGNWRTVLWAAHGFSHRDDLVRVQADGWGDPIAPHSARAQDTAFARERMAEWRSTMFPSKRQGELRRLGNMARLARSHGVRLVLVTTPVLPALRALESPATREWMRHSLDSLARREGISWFDLEADARFHPDDFADMDHLGPQGAWRFTSVLDSLMRTSPARR